MNSSDYEIISDDDGGVTARFHDQEKATLARVGLLMSGVDAKRLGIIDKASATDLMNTRDVHADGMGAAAFGEIYKRMLEVVQGLRDHAQAKGVVVTQADFRHSKSEETTKIRFLMAPESLTPDALIKEIRDATGVNFTTYDTGDHTTFALETHALTNENNLNKLKMLFDAIRQRANRSGLPKSQQAGRGPASG